MKTRKWPSLFTLLAACTVLLFTACEDWGQMDPIPGRDVAPVLEQVAEFTFDDVLAPEEIQTFAYPDGDVPDLVTDETRGQVLHLNKGYARIFNPLPNYQVQEAVSLTFWVKQVGPAILEDGTEDPEYAQDLSGAIFAFENSNASDRLFFTSNGWLCYEGPDGRYEYNNPADAETGIITPGEWHYVAVSVTNDGYFVYVDGKKKVEHVAPSYFDFSKMVSFMASVPYMYIGYGSDTENSEWWIDDVKLYRNQITEKEIAKPSTGGGEADYRNFIGVGNEDFSSAFFAAKSKLVRFKNNAHFGFYNYNNGTTNNWCNWVLAVTNGLGWGEDNQGTAQDAGYAEFFVLRADAYGWGDGSYDGSTISHNFNWDTFNAEMDGAYVDLTLTRSGSQLSMRAVITGTSGTEYTYTFSYTNENMPEVLSAFLTGEANYMELDVETVYADGASYAPGTNIVGAEDFSTAWWTVWSEVNVIDGDTEYPFVMIFDNHGSGANNWNNWVLVVNNGVTTIGGAGYSEYFVLRSDAYGWGTGYDAANLTSSFDWSTFIAQMQGARVRLILTRSGSRVNLETVQRSTDGSLLPPYTFHCDAITTSSIGVFLTCDASYYDILAVGYFPYADDIQQ